jgi:hypothetical protein
VAVAGLTTAEAQTLEIPETLVLREVMFLLLGTTHPEETQVTVETQGTQVPVAIQEDAEVLVATLTPHL